MFESNVSVPKFMQHIVTIMFTVANIGCVKMLSYLMCFLFLSSSGLCLLISSLLWLLNDFLFSYFRQRSIELFCGDRQELRMETAVCTKIRTCENSRAAQGIHCSNKARDCTNRNSRFYFPFVKVFPDS